MNIIGNKKIYLTISVLLVIASIVSIATLGLKQGIDFTGGTLWQFRVGPAIDTVDNTPAPISRAAVEGIFTEEISISEALVSTQGDNVFLVRLPEIDEATHQSALGILNEQLGVIEELRFETIGPSISSELRASSIRVFIVVLIAISLYVIFAFRKTSHRIASWKYGLITLVTLFHDAIITVGFFAVLGHLTGAEVDVSIVVAILVIMGFSVHDTIVVFDRIRENIKAEKNKGQKLGDVINKSVIETLARSINTSLTLILVLLFLYVMGAANLQYFILTILVGTIIGTYSSVFVASPILELAKKRS